MKLETLAVHAGYSPEPTTKSVAVPIYQTTSYAFDSTQHGADLLVSQLEGEPLPLERDLVDALDPGRFLLKAARQPAVDSEDSA